MAIQHLARRDARRRRAPLRRPVVLLALGTAAVALLASACGSSPHTSASGASGAAASASSVVRIADDSVVTTLNPVDYAAYEVVEVTYLWGGFLTTYGSGSAGGQPLLAQTVASSNDFKTWTVVLKPGMKFSDGSPITSADVVASFQYIAKESGADTNDFIGSFFSNLVGVTSAGKLTASFTFRDPNPDFAKEVAMPEMVIVPAARLAQGKSFWDHPISAGRYKVDSADLVNGSFSLTANPYYAGPSPKVKQVEITSVPSAATRLAQLRSGQTDYAENLPGDLIPQVKGDTRVDAAPWAGGSLLLLPNVKSGSILSDVRIRQAVNLALDRNQISQVALGGVEAGRPLYGIPWNQTNAAPNVQSFAQDLSKARALLRGTACQNGCTLPTYYFTNAVWQLPVTVQVVAQQLGQIGIRLQLRGVPLSQNLFPAGWGLAMWWTGFYDDSATYLSNYYVTGQWEQALTGFSSPAMTKLGQEMAVSAPSALPALIDRANTLFAQYQPIIPLTTLSYLAGSSLPAGLLTNTQAAYLDVS